jgi:hypothetical protein
MLTTMQGEVGRGFVIDSLFSWREHWTYSSCTPVAQFWSVIRDVRVPLTQLKRSKWVPFRHHPFSNGSFWNSLLNCPYRARNRKPEPAGRVGTLLRLPANAFNSNAPNP